MVRQAPSEMPSQGKPVKEADIRQKDRHCPYISLHLYLLAIRITNTGITHKM
jgi:hypothetical protein